MWRQFDKTIGEESTSINSELIRNGRKKLASTLRANSSSIIEVLVKKNGGNRGITSSEMRQTHPQPWAKRSVLKVFIYKLRMLDCSDVFFWKFDSD